MRKQFRRRLEAVRTNREAAVKCIDALDGLMAAVLDRYIAEQNARPKETIERFDAALRGAMDNGRAALADLLKEKVS